MVGRAVFWGLEVDTPTPPVFVKFSFFLSLLTDKTIIGQFFVFFKLRSSMKSFQILASFICASIFHVNCLIRKCNFKSALFLERSFFLCHITITLQIWPLDFDELFCCQFIYLPSLPFSIPMEANEVHDFSCNLPVALCSCEVLSWALMYFVAIGFYISKSLNCIGVLCF